MTDKSPTSLSLQVNAYNYRCMYLSNILLKCMHTWDHRSNVFLSFLLLIPQLIVFYQNLYSRYLFTFFNNGLTLQALYTVYRDRSSTRLAIYAMAIMSQQMFQVSGCHIKRQATRPCTNSIISQFIHA